MSEIIIVSPFAVTYDGNDADQHIISARPLGESIIGASKLYTATAHYCMFGTIPRGNYKKEFECFAMPAKEKCFEYHVFIAAIANEYALHGEIYKEGLGFIFSHAIEAIKKIWLKPTETTQVTEMFIELMKQQSRDNASVQTVLANGLSKANDNLASLQSKLIDTLPQIANATRHHGRMLVAPIGNSCTSISQFSNTPQVITIAEAEADVIRGNNDMEVDEMQKFNCKRITEINVENGHCIMDIEGFTELVTGKISDPNLEKANNIYTKSLNSQSSFVISAKPVKRNGVVQKLYVSDANENT